MRIHVVVYFGALAVLLCTPVHSLANTLALSAVMWCAGYWCRVTQANQ